MPAELTDRAPLPVEQRDPATAGGGGPAPGTLSALLSILTSALVLAAMLVLLEAAVTLLWQDPFSALYTRIVQGQLGGQLHQLERAAPGARERLNLAALPTDRARVARLAHDLKSRARIGSAVGRLRMPSLGVGYVLVDGTDTATLRKGPGIYPQTPFPGGPGTVAIAGHRTTYLAPFRHIDKLRRGQTVQIQMPYALLTYTVQGHKIVLPTDFSVIRSVGYERLVLTACDPPFSAARRIVVFARLTRIGPRGPAFPGRRSAAVPADGGPSLPLTIAVILAMLATPPALLACGRKLRPRSLAR